MQTLIAQLREKYNVDALAAAAIGISRQAFSQAARRGRLSESAALKSAAALGITPAAALVANCPAARDVAAPIDQPAPDASQKADICQPDNTNYASLNSHKKSARSAHSSSNIHCITSQQQQEGIDLIRWVYAVARLPADSPRFGWYVSRWNVPAKIARAKENGTFDDLTRNCPPIDPAWLRHVPAALAAWREFDEANQINQPNTRASSGRNDEGRNIAPLVA